MIDVSCTKYFPLIHTTKSVFFFLQNDLRLTCQHHPAKSAGWDGLEGRESLPGQGESFLTGDLDCLQQNCCGFHQKGSPMGQNS